MQFVYDNADVITNTQEEGITHTNELATIPPINVNSEATAPTTFLHQDRQNTGSFIFIEPPFFWISYKCSAFSIFITMWLKFNNHNLNKFSVFGYLSLPRETLSIKISDDPLPNQLQLRTSCAKLKYFLGFRNELMHIVYQTYNEHKKNNDSRCFLLLCWWHRFQDNAN